MAKGLNNEIIRHVFEVEPTAMVELFSLYYDYQNDSQAVIHFHPGTHGVNQKIVFDEQQYLPIPMESEGFEVLGNQKLPRPKIRVSNAGMYVSSLLRQYDNLNNAKLERRRTFVKFLDDTNFPNGNPFGSSNPNSKMPTEKYFVSRKILENKLFVELELVTSLEFENVNVPNRLVASRYCTWIYRGPGCRYGSKCQSLSDGLDRPVGDNNDKNFVTGSAGSYFLNSGIFPGSAAKPGKTFVNGTRLGVNVGSETAVLINSGMWYTGSHTYNPGDYIFRLSDRIQSTQDLNYNPLSRTPTYYVCSTTHVPTDNQFKPELRKDLWVADVCSKRLGGCKLRFANDDLGDGINDGKDLPYGGFIGTENFSY